LRVSTGSLFDRIGNRERIAMRNSTPSRSVLEQKCEPSPKATMVEFARVAEASFLAASTDDDPRGAGGAECSLGARGGISS